MPEKNVSSNPPPLTCPPLVWTIMTLVRGAVRAETTSMQGLIRFCYGFWGTVFLNVTLLFLAWGFLTSYTVIIGDELPSVLKSKKKSSGGDDGGEWWWNTFKKKKRG